MSIARVTRETDGCVYFCQAGARGPIKIGFSTQVTKRLGTIARNFFDWPPAERAKFKVGSGHRCDVRLRGVVRGKGADEWDTHRRFARLRLGRTEWFKPGPDLLQYIEQHAVMP